MLRSQLTHLAHLGEMFMPAIGSVHKTSINYGDVTHETGSFTMFTGAVTAVSIGGYLTALGAIQSATDAITLGVRRSQSWTGDLTTVTNAWPTDRSAQRESKLLVQYQDSVTEKPYTLTVPTIDYSKLNFVVGGGDNVEFAGANASTEIKAWVTAFEALGRSPDNDQNTVKVIGMRFVGSNT